LGVPGCFAGQRSRFGRNADGDVALINGALKLGLRFVTDNGGMGNRAR
jgi:hypothetical protein